MRTLGTIALGLVLITGGAMLLMGNAKSEASLDQAFDGAIKAINEERGKNRANEFGCTQFFSDFYLAKKIEPYVVFLKGRGVQAVIADVNQEHFISFTIPSAQLRTWGYHNFYRGDSLVLVFTTRSSRSDDITSSLQGWLVAPIPECQGRGHVIYEELLPPPTAPLSDFC